MSYRLMELIESALRIPTTGSLYAFSRHLRALYQGHAIVETNDCDFDLRRFAKNGKCACIVLPTPEPWTDLEWYGDPAEVQTECRVALIDVLWHGERLKVVCLPQGEFTIRSYIIADSYAVAEGFFSAVCEYATKHPERVLVYSRSRFHHDPGLERAIAAASLDDMILPDDIRKSIVSATAGFFASEAKYASLGVAWKRGVLLYGPPGNGKTHLLKALIREMEKPCLYVRSARSSDEHEAESLQRLFGRARQMTPCVMVMEDLDSLVPQAKISSLLNELDGFATNHGLLVLATTNYPEKLDPALVNRPSRFDRKFELQLPSEDLRREFLRKFVDKWPKSRRPNSKQIAKLARKSEGFAFVHLKEMCVDALVISADDHDGDPFITALKGVKSEMSRRQAAS